MKMTPCITLIPVGGLANRMKAIDAGIALAHEIGSRLKVIWFKDQGLNCRFNQLFESFDHANIEVVEATTVHLITHDRPRRKNFRIPSIFQKISFDACLYESEVTQLFYQNFDFANWASQRQVYIASCVYFHPNNSTDAFKMFKPIPILQKKIDEVCAKFSANTIGVHIRRTDNIASIEQSPTELFVERIQEAIQNKPTTQIYLATDSEEEKRILKSRFKEHIITNEREATRTSVVGVQDALIELYALSNTSLIYGSMKSSYSETAAQINNIPYELLKKGV